MGLTCYTSKSWVSSFSFKVVQHGQLQLHLQYKVYWDLYKTVGAFSFSQPNCIDKHLYNLHQKSILLPKSIFTSLFHRYLFTKSSLQSLLISLSLYLSNFSPPFFCVKPSQRSTPKIFSLPQPFSQFRLYQGTRELGSLVRTETLF